MHIEPLLEVPQSWQLTVTIPKERLYARSVRGIRPQMKTWGLVGQSAML